MEQYLTFSSQAHQFGIVSEYVREVFPLPKLQTVMEGPGDVVGLLNLRGQLIPVIQLTKRLGLPRQPFQVSDSVMVLDWQGLSVGLVVDRVDDVIDVPAAALLSPVEIERDNYVTSSLVQHYAQLDHVLLNILHPESLIRQADDVVVLAWEAELQQSDTPDSVASDGAISDFYGQCKSLSPLDRKIFARRARDLKAPLDATDISELKPITMISLEGEYFGVSLDHIREFIHVPKLTTIPGAQSHIIGNFNLRGEIITLLDLSASLDLPVNAPRAKAIILELDNQRIGLSVDEVHDVLYVAQEDYLEFPATLPQEHLSFTFGALEYKGEVVRLLNLKQLLEPYQPKQAIAA